VIEQISRSERAEQFESSILTENSEKKKLLRTLLNNVGIVSGGLILCVVIAVVTTDVQIKSLRDLADLGVDFFILMFLSYSMYVNCSDSGMRAGLMSSAYCNAFTSYNAIKKDVVDRNIHIRLGEFCRHWIDVELKQSRTSAMAVVGISYEEYMEKYVGMDRQKIDGMKNLSKAQRRAIRRANAIKPVHLTPDMMMKRGRGGRRRAPLGTSPEVKKGLMFGSKFISTLFIMLGMSLLAFEAVQDPTWEVFVTCIVKLVTVAMNGFSGYKFGYENIVIDTVNYMEDQTDLLGQAVIYCSPRDGEAGDSTHGSTQNIESDKVGTGACA
jgi:hypothetical protein